MQGGPEHVAAVAVHVVLLLQWAIPGHFFYFRLFDTVNRIYLEFADDWIRTIELWCRNRPLYQLSQRHCPFLFCFAFKFAEKKVVYAELIDWFLIEAGK